MSKPVLDEVLRRLEAIPEAYGLGKKKASPPRHNCYRSALVCDLCDVIDELADIREWAKTEEERQRLIFGEAKGPTL